MNRGLYAEYDSIRVWSSSVFHFEAEGSYSQFYPYMASSALHQIFDTPSANLVYSNLSSAINFTLGGSLRPPPPDDNPENTNHQFFVRMTFMDTILADLTYSANTNVHPVVSGVSMSLIIKRPKIYFSAGTSTPIMIFKCEGYTLNINSNVRELSISIDTDDVIIKESGCCAPSESVLFSRGLAGVCETNVLSLINPKIPFISRIDPWSSLSFGYSFRLPNSGAYTPLPIDLDIYPVSGSGFNPVPIVEGINTDNVYIKTHAWLYTEIENDFTVGYMHYEKVCVYNYPKRNREFIRLLPDDNILLVWKGSHPKLKKTKIYWADDEPADKSYITISPPSKRKLVVLPESSSADESILGIENKCPYIIYVEQNKTFSTKKYIVSFLMAENTALPPSRNDIDGENYNDPDYPIFSHLCKATDLVSSYYESYDEEASFIVDLFSFWNWVIYIPPDYDNEHWKLGVPLTKVNSENYWSKIREQYIYHSSLSDAENRKLRNYILDAPMSDSVISESCGNYLDIAYNFYSSEGFNVFTTGTKVSFPGLNNFRIVDINYISSAIAKSASRYTISGGSYSFSESGIYIIPSENQVVVEYNIGDFNTFPYLFDIFADKFSYNISGNASNVKIEFISSSGFAKEIYNGNILSQTINKVIERDEKYAGSHIQSILPPPDEGLDLLPEGISSTIFNNPKYVINYSLISSGNISKIKFTISVSGNIFFSFLSFSSTNRRVFNHIIENANVNVIVDNKNYFRIGNLSYMEPTDNNIKSVPEVRSSKYRMNVVDVVCLIRNLLKAQNKNDDEVFDYLSTLYDSFEFSDLKSFASDTYMMPISNRNTRKTEAGIIRFIYGCYLSSLPPISSLPQFSKNENLQNINDITQEKILLYCPYKRFIWNYINRLHLFRVIYDDYENETSRTIISADASEYESGEIKISKYVLQLENNEVVRKWNGELIRSPQYIVSKNEGGDYVDLSRITPFRGHTFNELLTYMVPPARKVIYRCWIDDDFAGKIYLLGYNTETQEYLHGFYDPKRGIFSLSPKPERSQDFYLLANLAYLEFDRLDRTAQSDKKFVYKIKFSDETIGEIKIGGRRPSIAFYENRLYIGSRDDINGGYYLQYFEIKNEEILPSPNLIVYDNRDISTGLPGCMNICVLDKFEGIFVYTIHTIIDGRKDVLIVFFDKENIQNEVFGQGIKFSDIFGTSVEYSYPYIAPYDHYLVISSKGSDGKIYLIILPEEYRIGMNISSLVIDNLNIELQDYFAPLVCSNVPYIFLNVNSDENFTAKTFSEWSGLI